MRQSPRLGFALMLLILADVACDRGEPTPESRTTAGNANVPETTSDSPSAQALRAKDDLFRRLSSELLTAMSQGGPAKAIEVCRDQAPKIAAEVGRDHNVKIGRTSFKLRNSDNVPPDWAQGFVDERAAEPCFVELDNGGSGALFPIRLQAQCVVCHGDAAKLGEDVRQQLAQLYPADSATGFREGDLRGWFWVEVPPTTNTDAESAADG